MKTNKSIHFVGIKGVGMAPLAIIAKEAGFKVSGCDINEEFITDEALSKANITPLVGFSISHVETSDLVITTGAHGGFDNPEVSQAKKKGITVWTQGQALGEFMKGTIFEREFETVAVAGSHGKTTTTAMIATILKANRIDSSFLIGTGNVPYLETDGHFGKGRFFVAEADEYATEPTYDKTPKFLWLHPNILVITNIELDHPDLFADIEQLSLAFLTFAKNAKDKIVACMDDEEVKKIRSKISGSVITYGFSKEADFVIEKVSMGKEGMFFWVSNKNTNLGEFILNVTGEHNALNALAATVACLELGISIENIKKGLAQFNGTKRRSEFVKQLHSGAMLFDDYAHHPTEIKKTLLAFQKTYPDKKILCIFQPHTYSRTKKLFEQFTNSFNQASEIILVDIYSSLREKPDSSVSSLLLKERISAKGQKVGYFSNLPDMVEYVADKKYDDKWIILTMGAGDIYKIANNLN